jgi:hypothetical protein
MSIPEGSDSGGVLERVRQNRRGRAEAIRSGGAINRVTLTTDQATPVTVEELTTVIVQ